MKKILLLMLTVVMLFTFGVVAVFATETEETTITTEAELNSALAEGGNVVLGADINVTEAISIPKNVTVTLDLNGYTISQAKECTASYEMISNKGSLTITGNGKISFTDTGAGDSSASWGAYTIKNEGTLVVENGTIENLSAQNVAGQPFAHTVFAIFQYSGSCTINGGTISCPSYRSIRLWKGDMTINGGTFEGQIWIQCQDDSAKLTINGGEFTNKWSDGSSVFIENQSYDAEVSITDGTFNGKVGCSDATKIAGAITGGTFSESAKNGTNEALIAEGYELVENADGTYGVAQENYVAQIGETKYETLGDAINAANGAEIIILSDISAGSVAISSDVVIDLNGHTLTSTSSYFFYINAGTLTVKDTSEAKTGTLILDHTVANQGNLFYMFGNGSSLTLEDITVVSNNNVIFAYQANNTIAIENCALTSVVSTGAVFYLYCTETTLEINGGTYKGSTVICDFGPGYTDVDYTITAGQFSQDISAYCANGYHAELNASGLYEVVKNPEVNEENAMVKVGDTLYLSIADALKDAQANGVSDLVITIIGANTNATADSFDLYSTTVFNSVTIKQENGGSAYYLSCVYTGVRTSSTGRFVFDGVNIAITEQIFFECDSILTNNSVITCNSDIDNAVYYGTLTVEPGSKFVGLVDNIVGGSMTVDGGNTNGSYNEAPDYKSVFLDMANGKLLITNGAYVLLTNYEYSVLTIDGVVEIDASMLEVLTSIVVGNNAHLKLDTESLVKVGSITGGGVITIDASNLSAEEVTVIKAKMSGFTGTIEVEGNATYEITSTGLVIKRAEGKVFTDKGYSTSLDGIAHGFTVDHDLLKAYMERNGYTSVEFGAVFAVESIDKNAIHKLLSNLEMTNTYNIILNGVTSDYYDLGLVLNMYVSFDGAEKQYISEASELIGAQDVIAVTYNQFKKEDEE